MVVSAHFQTKALYLQVRDILARRIVSREWRPGALMPNEFELARELSVSIGTVRRSLSLLESDGLIRRQQGRGTFVNDPESDEFANRFSNIRDKNGFRIGGRIRSGEVTRRPANPDECQKLGLIGGGEVYAVKRWRYHEERAFMLENSVLPAHLFRDVTPERGTYRITSLASANGIRLGDAEETIRAAVVADNTYESIGVAPGNPLLVLERVVCCADHRPIEWRIGYCNFTTQSYAVSF